MWETVNQLMGRGLIHINWCCMCKHLEESCKNIFVQEPGKIFFFIERCLVSYGLSQLPSPVSFGQ